MAMQNVCRLDLYSNGVQNLVQFELSVETYIENYMLLKDFDSIT